MRASKVRILPHPPPTTDQAGVAQLVERQPSKLNVASSNLVSRSVSSIGFGAPTLNPGIQTRSSRTGEVLTPTAEAGPFRFAKVKRDQLGWLWASDGSASGRSRFVTVSAHLAQLVEHVLGKDEVTSSILVVGSKRLVRSLMALDPNASSPAPGCGRARAFRFAVAAA